MTFSTTVTGKDGNTYEFRPLVYICSPYSGRIRQNTETARRFSRFAVDSGCIPIAPHLLLPQFMDEKTERHDAMHADLVIMGKCKEVFVLVNGNYISGGMLFEISKAISMKKPLRFFTSDGDTFVETDRPEMLDEMLYAGKEANE